MNRKDEILQGTKVTFCIDTNIIVEFKSLKSLPWRELAPNVANVHIIVPTKVAEEMDSHKKKSGRLRRRGMEFSNLARAIEDSSDETIEVKAADPRVTISFGPVFRKSELDGDRYELDDNDGRIVAEISRIMQSFPDALLLSDDAKPIRLAKQANLLHTRPPLGWRREEGPDDRDTEIDRLQRELGAQPELTVELPALLESSEKRIIVDPPPAEVCTACVAKLVHAACSVDPEVTRNSLVNKYGVQQYNSRVMSNIFNPGLRQSDIDEYAADYKKFVERLNNLAKLLPKVLGYPGIVRPLHIRVANVGDRAAERVHVEAELRGDFSFIHINYFNDLLERHIEPPDAPSPKAHFVKPFLPFVRDRAPPRDDLFHELDEPDSSGETKLVSWRCNELRHGASFGLPILVVAKKLGAAGALDVRASGAVIAKTVSLTAPLVQADQENDGRFCKYIVNRIELLPHKYKDACDAAFRLNEPNCLCEQKPRE